MGFFSNILDKLGFDRADPKPAAVAQAAPVAQTGTYGGTTSAATGAPGATAAPAAKAAPAPQPTATPAPTVSPAPAPITAVDVVAKLEGLAASNPQKLNWRESIVDLLKLLGLDSSFAARKELAIELGCPIEKMGDSAQMNVWLHKAVLRKLAQSGGNVPKELL
jgi:Domain of unknown function (DUF3597)